MKRSTVLTKKNRGAWATAFAAIILLPVALSLLGMILPREGDAAASEVNRTTGEFRSEGWTPSQEEGENHA